MGVPAPAGALAVLFPVYLELAGVLPHWPELAPVVALYVVAIALLMVSRLPTFSGKKLGSRIRRDLVLPLFVAAVFLVALLVSYPFEILALGVAGYLVSIPLAWHWHQRYLKDEPAETVDDGEDETDLDHLGDDDKDDAG